MPAVIKRVNYMAKRGSCGLVVNLTTWYGVLRIQLVQYFHALAAKCKSYLKFTNILLLL